METLWAALQSGFGHTEKCQMPQCLSSGLGEVIIDSVDSGVLDDPVGESSAHSPYSTISNRTNVHCPGNGHQPASRSNDIAQRENKAGVSDFMELPHFFTREAWGSDSVFRGYLWLRRRRAGINRLITWNK